MSLLNKEDYNHVYSCPNCVSKRISFLRERSIDGNAEVRCNDCGWSHSEPNRLGYSNNQLYCRGVAAYRPTGSEHIAYPDEKTERELLEEILAELKEIKQQIILVPRRTGFEKYEDPCDRIAEKYEKNSDLITTPPGFKAPDIMCVVKEEESDESN